MELLASGRDCDIFDLGDGTVLRRQRDGRSLAAEAAVLRHVAGHGFPCPALHRVDGPDMVLDLVEGPTMTQDVLADPSDERARAAGVLSPARELLDAFLDSAGRDDARGALPEAVTRRLADGNATDEERAAVRSLLAREHGP